MLMQLTVEGLVPMGAPRRAARGDKPRMSFDQLAAARQDCVPCRAALAVRGYLRSWTGYGVVSGGVGRGLDAAGVPVAFVGLADQTPAALGGPTDPWVMERTAGGPRPGMPVLQVGGGDIP